MINIYTKTKEELDKENSLYRFGAAIAKSVPKKACPTYLKRVDDTRVDTNQLTEEQIVGLILRDIQDFCAPNGSYKQLKRDGLDTFKLLELVKNTWTPSCEAILTIAALEEKYGHIVADVIGTLDKNGIMGNARTIASFQKQTRGDFSSVTEDEVLAILQQMVINEQMRNKSRSKK